MKFTFHKILALAAAVVTSQALWAASPLTGVINNPTYKEEYLGEWYGGPYMQAIQWADANHVPVVMVWGAAGCSKCKNLDNDVLDTDRFINYRKERKLVMVYIKDNVAARDFTRKGVQNPGGKEVALREFPLVLVYWKQDAASKAIEQRFVGRTGRMLVTGGSLLDQFIKSIDKYTSDYNAVPPVGKITMTSSIPEGEILVEGTNTVITYTL